MLGLAYGFYKSHLRPRPRVHGVGFAAAAKALQSLDHTVPSFSSPTPSHLRLNLALWAAVVAVAVVACTATPPAGFPRRDRAGLSLAENGLLGSYPWLADATHAAFAVRYRGQISRYRTNFVAVLPGQDLEITVVDPTAEGEHTVRVSAGSLVRRAATVWSWTAPQAPGNHDLEISGEHDDASILLRAFVMVPRTELEDGHLGDYYIGAYPERAYRGLSSYRKPSGFIEVTEDDVDIAISPNFRLGEFLCKQDGDFPKYMILSERLVLKLEYLRERFLAAGYAADRLHVMSAYRTPQYNAALGNGRYSRHLWGAAADIFIDTQPEDGLMDDLNGDGAVDRRDAGVLYNLVEAERVRPGYVGLRGGMARYRANRYHGPFLHVDVRPGIVRW